MQNEKIAGEKIINLTKDWIETFIIGLNICPFAKKHYINEEVRLKIIDSKDEKAGIDALIEELHFLESHHKTETSLLIYPLHKDLSAFQQFYLRGEQTIYTYNFGFNYLVVAFHPLMRYADQGVKSPARFTGLAPYPIIHILRKSSVDAVGVKLKNDILAENDKKLEKMGWDSLFEMWKDLIKRHTKA